MSKLDSTTAVDARAITKRKERGAAIAASGKVYQSAPLTYRILNKPYLITLGEKVAACTCPDYAENGAELGLCKHIVAARIVRRAASRVKTMGADNATLHAVTRLAWERDPFTVNCLKALALAARGGAA
jgi:hypothetical protein